MAEEETDHTKMSHEEKLTDHQHHHLDHHHDHHHTPKRTTPNYYRSPRQGILACLTTLLILAGITALIVWLVYRPDDPRITVISAAIYSVNTSTPPFLATSMQFTVLIRNPNRRTSIHYDHLSITLFYRNQPITPPLDLPPLYQEKHSTVALSPMLGGSMMVPVSAEVMNGLAADEQYGVMGLRLVFMGRVRYTAGAIRTSHHEFYARCDLLVGFRRGYVGLVPLLQNPQCKVDT